jgi:hypothetical protein
MFHPRDALSVAALLILPTMAIAQSSKSSTDARIHNAVMGGPASVAANATVLEWPAGPSGTFTELRAGSNGWYCLPDLPLTPNDDDPMCVDQVWLDFLKAMMAGKKPEPKGVGVGYMTHGGAYSSNTDPNATKATSDNDWGYDPPHIMIISPDVSALKAYPTTRKGGPWVMFPGTPYAHLMVPVEDGAHKR